AAYELTREQGYYDKNPGADIATRQMLNKPPLPFTKGLRLGNMQTSFGTGMGHDLDFYRHIPLTSMPYGQAMAMLCLTEYLRNY
ncbi:glycoside hydrolase family 88 protein, partial [Salmonella enterica subsp. enterica serovar Anatum]|nr:glycoside hydrolase family 88 protein [Salmonella enterica subsp. enterica serovar Anatum]